MTKEEVLKYLHEKESEIQEVIDKNFYEIDDLECGLEEYEALDQYADYLIAQQDILADIISHFEHLEEA